MSPLITDSKNIAVATLLGWTKIRQATSNERRVMLPTGLQELACLVGIDSEGLLDVIPNYCEDSAHLLPVLRNLTEAERGAFTIKLAFVMKRPYIRYLWEASPMELVDAFIKFKTPV